MNRDFLYKKVRAIGDIDEGNNSNNIAIASWFTDTSKDDLKKLLSESSLEELIKNLIDIFMEGNPNYKELAVQLEVPYDKRRKGHEIVEVPEKNLIIWSLHDIDRKDKDIKKVEMYIDSKCLIIRKLYLYSYKLPNINLLGSKINAAYGNISCEKDNELVINGKECIIFLGN